MKPAATDLEQLIQSELGPQLRPGALVVAGPAVAIEARASAVMATALRELVAEAQSAGAPLARCSDVAIAWSRDDQGRCVIELDGVGGPLTGHLNGGPVPGPEQCSALPRAGEGMIRFDVSERGVRIVVPARYVAGWSPIDGREIIAPAAAPPDPLTGRRVLVLEDQLIIALDLEALLREQGAAEVHLLGSAAEGLRFVASEQPDVAILDVNLGSTTSFPVARQLLRLGVPFIFATGYGNEVEFPPELRAVPLVGKPYCIETMRKALLASCMALA